MKNALFTMIVVMFVLFGSSFSAEAHGGRTNASGCHTNSATGDYHCHNTKTPTTTTFCHVYNGTSRCGYAESTCNSLVRQHGGYCSRG